MVLDVFKWGVFPLPPIDSTVLKILTPVQMLHRLPIVIGQTKAGSTSENLVNEIRQIIHFLHQQMKLLKKYITI